MTSGPYPQRDPPCFLPEEEGPSQPLGPQYNKDAVHTWCREGSVLSSNPNFTLAIVSITTALTGGSQGV